MVILDDNGESVFDLAIFQEAMRYFPHLHISIAVNRYPVSTNFTRASLEEVLADPEFSFFQDQRMSGRARIITESQLFPAFEEVYFSQPLRNAIDNSDVLYVKGVNFFEALQPAAQLRYYGFVVSGRMSHALSGCHEGRSVFARVPRGYPGYVYNTSGEVQDLKRMRQHGFRNA